MKNNLIKTTCKNCDKIFYYIITEMPYPGGKDKEIIYCPYCHTENGSIITSGFVYSYTLKEISNKHKGEKQI